jgi:hypothetical protein
MISNKWSGGSKHVSSLPKMDKDHKKFMADRINLLRGSVDAASHSPQHICIITDASNPPLPLQSVAAFRLWHEGDLYDDWSAAGLSTSDDAELRAIADRVRQAYNIGLEDVRQIHVFSDSANALRLTMDASHHSGQHTSLSICTHAAHTPPAICWRCWRAGRTREFGRRGYLYRSCRRCRLAPPAPARGRDI